MHGLRLRFRIPTRITSWSPRRGCAAGAPPDRFSPGEQAGGGGGQQRAGASGRRCILARVLSGLPELEAGQRTHIPHSHIEVLDPHDDVVEAIDAGHLPGLLRVYKRHRQLGTVLVLRECCRRRSQPRQLRDRAAHPTFCADFLNCSTSTARGGGPRNSARAHDLRCSRVRCVAEQRRSRSAHLGAAAAASAASFRS